MHDFSFPVLQTKRLLLRSFTMEDAEALSVLRSNAKVNQYIVRPKTLLLDEAASRLQELMKEVREGRLFYWAISLAKEPTLIGTCCLFRFSDDRTIAELGYELHPNFYRQGLTTEAVNAVLAFAFRVPGLQTLRAVTHELNQASIQILLKAGFHLKSAHYDMNLPGFQEYELHKKPF